MTGKLNTSHQIIIKPISRRQAKQLSIKQLQDTFKKKIQ